MEKGAKRSEGLWGFLKKKGNGRLLLLVGGVLLGILLLLLGGGAFEKTSQVEAEADALEDAEDLSAYQAKIEKDLEDLCDAVAGVSSVEVMVTLGSGRRIVYATDGEGDVITVGSGSSQQALYRTVQPPTVVGVGVVCKGGNDPHVQNRLTDLISTALGITSNRVYVTGK